MAQFGTPKRIADTFTLAEGPVWDPCTKQLLFTDVEAQQIHTLSPDGSIGVYYEPSNYANGLAFDAQGRLLLAEMGGGMGGRITRLDRALNLEVLIDHYSACGKLNTVDDLVVRSDGTIYFSDPVIAHGNYLGFSLSAKPVYRLAPGSGQRMLVKEGQAQPTQRCPPVARRKHALRRGLSRGARAAFQRGAGRIAHRIDTARDRLEHPRQHVCRRSRQRVRRREPRSAGVASRRQRSDLDSDHIQLGHHELRIRRRGRQDAVHHGLELALAAR